MMLDLSPRTLFRPTVLLAFALMAVIAMMVLPVPTWLLDIGLALSFALAILMFTDTFKIGSKLCQHIVAFLLLDFIGHIFLRLIRIGKTRTFRSQ
mgnify:CR=1 FL=1